MAPASRALLCCAALFLLAGGCSYKTEKTPAGEGELERPSAALISRVSYSDVQGIFRAHCVSCHGTGGGVNLETYPAALAHLEKIRLSTIVERRMPKSPEPPLSSSDRLTLWAWIESGGRELPPSGEPAKPNPTPVLEPKYESIRSEILAKKCFYCHSPRGEAERIPLLTREDLLDSPLDIVVPGNPSESGLYFLLLPGARKPMPPPDSWFAPATELERQVVKEWIERGAKD